MSPLVSTSFSYAPADQHSNATVRLSAVELDNLNSHQGETDNFIRGRHAKLVTCDDEVEAKIEDVYVIYHKLWTRKKLIRILLRA